MSKYFTKTAIAAAEPFWLGAFRPTSQSGWSWLDSSPFVFTNWLKSDYDLTQRCAILSGNQGSKWFTTECDDALQDLRYRYICKKQNSDPLPTTTSRPTQPGVNYGCEQGWLMFESSCYKLSNALIGDHVSFDDARQSCKNNRADLVEVFSERENEFLVSMLRTRQMSRMLNCPTGWFMAYGSCYKLVSTSTNDWKFGQDYCSILGGYLASIKSIQEQTFLASQITELGIIYYYSGYKMKLYFNEFLLLFFYLRN